MAQLTKKILLDKYEAGLITSYELWEAHPKWGYEIYLHNKNAGTPARPTDISFEDWCVKSEAGLREKRKREDRAKWEKDNPNWQGFQVGQLVRKKANRCTTPGLGTIIAVTMVDSLSQDWKVEVMWHEVPKKQLLERHIRRGITVPPDECRPMGVVTYMAGRTIEKA